MVSNANGQIITVNPAFTRITGYSPEEAIGQTPRLLKSGRHEKPFYDALWHSLNQSGFWQGEIFNKRKNGETYPEWLTINAVPSNDGKIHNLCRHVQRHQRDQNHPAPHRVHGDP
jgi:PAS domain S-box-containing protein